MDHSPRSEPRATGGAAVAAADLPSDDVPQQADRARLEGPTEPRPGLPGQGGAQEPSAPLPSPAPTTGARVAEDLVSDARAAAEDAAAEARVAAGRAAEAASVAARTVASRSARAAQLALGSVQGGLRDAKLLLEEEQAAWDRVAQASALPGISGPDAMSSLAARLDREAGFWRAFAIDRMRPAAPRAIAVAGAAIGAVGAAVLGSAAAIGALFGSGASAGTLGAGAGALAVGVLTALACAAWLDRTATRATNEALARADRAERTLHRVASILALSQSGDAERHRDALARFERG